MNPTQIKDPVGAPEAPSPEVTLKTLTPHVALKRVVVLVNPLSGGVGPRAADEVEALLADYGCDSEVVLLEGSDFNAAIEAALSSRPDLVAVLAGDGTARFVASRAGPDGPLVAPLPGGTMNMLPKALYGTTDWKAALTRTLEDGEPQFVSGGKVQGEPFYCAAVLGSPALWGPAREAVRVGKLGLAWGYARRALRRAWTGQLRFQLDGAPSRKGEALILISPMISKVMDDPVGLEAAVINTADAAQAVRLAAYALFADWRQDSAVTTQPIRKATINARSRIPAVIDGEPIQLAHATTVTFTPRAFRALVPRPVAIGDAV